MAANDLLDRYLYAVSRYLPNSRQNDLLSELAANLRAEMDDKAAELGRSLSEDEQVQVLRRHGPPLIVAARYQPQRSLIGPEIFPFYAFTVKRLLPLVLGVNLLAQAAAILFGQTSLPLAQRVHPLAILVDLFYAALMFLVSVTVAFAFVEAYVTNWRGRLEKAKWDPRKLPKARPIAQEGPRHPWGDVIAGTVFLAWLLLFPHYPTILVGPYVAWHLVNQDLPAVWHTFYWIIVGFNGIQLAFRLAQLSRPMRRYFLVFDAIQHLLGIGVLAYLLHARDYVGQATFGGAPLSPQTVATVNASIHGGLLLVLVMAVFKFLWDTAQRLRTRMRNRTPIHA